MLREFEITCIVLSGGFEHQHITHVGLSNGQRMEKQHVVFLIEKMGDKFYVLDKSNGKHIQVSVVDTTLDISSIPPHKYIRTKADGKWLNNLLSLPACVVGF